MDSFTVLDKDDESIYLVDKITNDKGIAKIKVKFNGEDGLLDKKQLDEYMKKIYIENIWCFSRNENFDLLQRSSLERIMS